MYVYVWSTYTYQIKIRNMGGKVKAFTEVSTLNSNVIGY